MKLIEEHQNGLKGGNFFPAELSFLPKKIKQRSKDSRSKGLKVKNVVNKF